MATSRIRLPDDPQMRRIHLTGMRSALQNWSEADVLKARPVLSGPEQDTFDGARNVGLGMVRKNAKRKKALQQGRPGVIHRLKEKAREKLERWLTLP